MLDQGPGLSMALYDYPLLFSNNSPTFNFLAFFLKREIQFSVFVLALCNAIILTYPQFVYGAMELIATRVRVCFVCFCLHR